MRRRAVRNVPDVASCSETRSFVAKPLNQMGSLMNTQLNQFPRATKIAQGYQMYRIKSIALRFKPSFDTFINSGNAYQKPFLYYMIDKSGSIPANVTLEGLKQMGAKPRVFDEKAVVVAWKPSVLTFGATALSSGIGLPNKYVISPWLSTSENVTGLWTASLVDHLGIYFMATAALTGEAPPISYDYEVEVQFEFKKPLITASTANVSATPAVFATSTTALMGSLEDQMVSR